MPDIVGQKNIDPVVADIRKPGERSDRHYHRGIVHLDHEPERPAPRFRPLKRAFLIGFSVLVILFLASSALLVSNANEIRGLISGRGEEIAENFLVSLEALGRLKPSEAEARLVKNDQTFTMLQNVLDSQYGGGLFDVFGSVVPAIKEGRDLLTGVTALNGNFLALSESLAELQTNGFSYFQSDGVKLISVLNRLQDQIVKIKEQAALVKNMTSKLRGYSAFFENIDNALSDNYVKRSAELTGLEQFIAGTISVLKSDTDKHLLVLFQNPAELRPGGGFIGSYADVTVREGQMVNLDVRDIYDPDGQLKENVVPPEALKTITARWGARDANWFFDFPLSAKTVVGFLESSLMYKEKGVTFDVAIAININLLQTILEYVGPIPLPDYNLTITSDNFLSEIQREVEAGKDKVAGVPKRILSSLTPLILDRLNGLSEGDRRALLDAFGTRLAKKDVMVYAKNPALQGFFAAHGADGSIYEAPNDFWGTYLAVVNANVAGGKADAFVDQVVDARIDIDTDGGALTDLTVTRTHTGNTQKDPWWRAFDQNYLKIFSNPGSSLVGLTGNDTKTVPPLVDYATSSFTVNPDLEAIEQTMQYSSPYKAWTMQESGKAVVATWFNVAAGKTKTLEARLQSPEVQDFSLVPGKIFTFVFDRQSGAQGQLNVTILAPLGYTWAESSSPIFTQEIPDPDARVTISITLIK